MVEAAGPEEAQDEPAHEGGQHGHSLFLPLTVHTLVNVVLNALAAYGIGWLITNKWTVSWYTHEPELPLERGFVAGDLAVAAALTALIVTGIVGWLVYRDWDKGKIKPTTLSLFAIKAPRTRGKHLLVVAVVVAGMLALVAVAGTEMGFRAADLETMEGEAFPAIRATVGAVVGGIAAIVTTLSLVVNLSRDKLTEPEDDTPAVARISLWSSRNPVIVLVVTALITVGLGAGLADVHTDVDVADVLPRGNPHSEAAHNLTDRFKSSYTQEMQLQFQINPSQCRQDSQNNLPLRDTSRLDCGNITDEVYVRAMDEFFSFLQNYTYEEEGEFPWDDDEIRESPVAYQIGLPTFWKLLNWTIAGGQDYAQPSAFSLPGPSDRARAETIRETGWQTLRTTMTPTMDPSLEQAVILYLVQPDEERGSQEIGQFMIEARDAYLEWAPGNADYKVFLEDNKPLHTVDLPVANAHSSELAREDFRLFLPLIAVFLLVALYVLFRDLTSVLMAAGSLGLGVVWTYGLMGHMDIALNNLNLTVLPLIMGSGIDYSIHMVNEFLEHKHEGASDDHAFRIAGERAGVALLIATLVTLAGLLVMVLSPSLLLAELGLLAMVAMTSVYLLTVAFIPAALSLVGNTDHMGAEFTPSELVPRLGEFVCRHRVAFAVFAVIITAGSVVGIQALGVEEFGEPALNWPEDDSMRQEHIAGLAGFYDVDPDEPVFKANAVIVQGDITDPETHAYLDRLQSSLRTVSTENDVIEMHTSRHLPFIIRSWLKVCCGPTGVATGSLSEILDQEGYEEYSEYPKTRGEVQRTLDDMFASPYATFSSLFVDYPANEITVMTVSVRTGNFENAQEAWGAVTEAFDRADASKPDGVHVAFVGNTPTNYLFSQEQLPWLNYMSIFALIAAALLVFAFTRDLKATMAVTAVVGLSSLWVMGLLPALGIGLAITLMLPLVFIFSIGSDYAVHMVWNIKRVGDTRRVYATVGKAVLYSAVTDMGAFAILAPIPGTPHQGIQDLMVRDAIIATVVAIGVIFLATLLLISMFYDVEPAEAEGPAGEEAAAGAPAAVGAGPAR